MAHEITDAAFKEEVVDAQQKVLVDFYADWCGPCKMMAPIIDELSKTYEDKVKFAKLNVDNNPIAAGAYKVMSIPTFILFENGTPTETITGAVTKQRLINLIEGKH